MSRTWVPDHPGELMKLLELVARERVNVLSGSSTGARGSSSRSAATEIALTLLMRDEAHCKALLDHGAGWGYSVERLR